MPKCFSRVWLFSRFLSFYSQRKVRCNDRKMYQIALSIGCSRFYSGFKWIYSSTDEWCKINILRNLWNTYAITMNGNIDRVSYLRFIRTREANAVFHFLHSRYRYFKTCGSTLKKYRMPLTLIRLHLRITELRRSCAIKFYLFLFYFFYNRWARRKIFFNLKKKRYQLVIEKTEKIE